MPPDELGKVEVIVKLSPAASMHDSSERHRTIQEKAAALGVVLQPLHPSTVDPELASYAVTHIDPADADFVIKHIKAWDDVEGVYAKPAGEPPEGEDQYGSQSF